MAKKQKPAEQPASEPKKRKWRVHGAVYGTKYIGIFEAETKEEAEEMAAESDACYIFLCHHCAHEVDLNPDIGEITAEPVSDEEDE